MMNKLTRKVSFLDCIRHVNKIPAYTAMDMQIDYVLYLISQLSVVTTEQLLAVCESSKRQLAMAIQYGLRKDYIETGSMVYYGVNINYYFLKQEGKKRIFRFLDVHDMDLKEYDRFFRKNIEHFLEISELYISQFYFSRNEHFVREQWLYLENSHTVRSDAELTVTLDQFKYRFAIEHDRGTERLDVLKNKFIKGYNYQLLNNEPQIIVVTVSKEDLVNRKKLLMLSTDPKIQEIKRYTSAIDKVTRIMTKCKFTTFIEIEEALASSKPESVGYIEVLVQQGIDAINLVKEFVKVYGIETKKELTKKKDALDDLRTKIQYELLVDSVVEFERGRVEKIENAIMKLDSKTQLDLETVSKYSASLRERGSIIDGIFYLPSFKTQLLTHEFVIGPLVEIKTWMADFTNNHDNVALWIENTFNHQLTNINKGVELKAGEVLFKKVLSAYNGIDKMGKTIAVMQLDLQYNLSDKLKLECLGKDLIVHQYDELNVLVKEGEKDIRRFTF